MQAFSALRSLWRPVSADAEALFNATFHIVGSIQDRRVATRPLQRWRHFMINRWVAIGTTLVGLGLLALAVYFTEVVVL